MATFLCTFFVQPNYMHDSKPAQCMRALPIGGIVSERALAEQSYVLCPSSL